MSYRHIENLYRNKDILYFKQCYAMEKIHGTSANVSYNQKNDSLSFFSGGSKHEEFISLFDKDALLEKFRQNALEHPTTEKITIYGEAYGGKVQKMRDTYGQSLRFVAFEVLINSDWLSVPRAELFSIKFGFEFVHYVMIDTTEEAINAEMMADSVQAVRNGMGPNKIREGIVLRPIVELIHPNGGRIISKHKRPEFSERENTPKFIDPEKFKVIEDAKAVALEWVNAQRLTHVLDALGMDNPRIEDANKIIKGMIDDVYREAKDEIVESKAVRKAIGSRTIKVLKEHLNKSLVEPTWTLK